MRDTGMPNGRELYRMRIENVDFDAGSIMVPDSKTKSGTRAVPLSDRASEILRSRCGGGAHFRLGVVIPLPGQAHRGGHGEPSVDPGK